MPLSPTSQIRNTKAKSHGPPHPTSLCLILFHVLGGPIEVNHDVPRIIRNLPLGQLGHTCIVNGAHVSSGPRYVVRIILRTIVNPRPL